MNNLLKALGKMTRIIIVVSLGCLVW